MPSLPHIMGLSSVSERTYAYRKTVGLPVGAPIPGYPATSLLSLPAASVFIALSPFWRNWNTSPTANNREFHAGMHRFCGEKPDFAYIYYLLLLGLSGITLSGSRVGMVYDQFDVWPAARVYFTDAALDGPIAGLVFQGGAIALLKRENLKPQWRDYMNNIESREDFKILWAFYRYFASVASKEAEDRYNSSFVVVAGKILTVATASIIALGAAGALGPLFGGASPTAAAPAVAAAPVAAAPAAPGLLSTVVGAVPTALATTAGAALSDVVKRSLDLTPKPAAAPAPPAPPAASDDPAAPVEPGGDGTTKLLLAGAAALAGFILLK